MPWSIHKRGDKHCVVKDGESSPVPGGCHDSRADAVKHQRALYASEEVATVDEMSETKTPAGYWLVPMPETMTTASANVTVTVAVEDEEVEDEVVADLSEEAELVWEGVIGIEGLATTDRRYLIPGGISERDLPLTLMAQTQTADGHQGAEVAGKITEIWREPREDLGAGAIAIMGRGVFDAGEMGQEIARMVEDEILRGVSLDLGVTEAEMLDPKTFEPVAEELDLMEMLTGDFITGIRGEILGATLCAFPAFRDATVAVVTASGHLSMESAFGIRIAREVLTAAAAGMTPLHPPVDWFSNPHLNGPTALEISEDGRVFGHLALWGTCHTGIPGVCTTAPPSYTNYKMFHLGVVDTAESIPISCGQITLDTGHAPTSYAAEKTIAHYDDTGCAVADVVCGEDSFGIWVAGAVRPGIKAETVRKLRGSKLSGDWRSVGGHLELVGILAVNVPGFPVPRAQAAIAASAAGEGEVLALVAAGIVGDTTYRARRRKKSMLSARLREALGPKESTRARMRRAAMK